MTRVVREAPWSDCLAAQFAVLVDGWSFNRVFVFRGSEHAPACTCRRPDRHNGYACGHVDAARAQFPWRVSLMFTTEITQDASVPLSAVLELCAGHGAERQEVLDALDGYACWGQNDRSLLTLNRFGDALASADVANDDAVMGELERFAAGQGYGIFTLFVDLEH